MLKRFIILILILTFGLLNTSCAKKESPIPKEAKEEVKAIKDELAEELTLKGISTVGKGGKFEGFFVYVDRGYFKNHFAPSGWMGDYSDLKINEGCKESVHSRKNCIKITYTATAGQGASWAGIHWQNPPNNWGEKKGGFDLTGAKKLSFWACGEKGTEVIAEFKMGGITGTYSDSDSGSLGPVTLTNQWQEYFIDLTGMDLSYISGGFCFIIKRTDNPDGCVFYLDDIKYE